MRIRFAIAAAAAGLAVAVSPVEAKLYKWVDADGNVTYSERRPPEGNRAHQKLPRSERDAD